MFPHELIKSVIIKETNKHWTRKLPMVTDRKPPAYKDQAWKVRQMIDEWNGNM